jgi:serine/threonine protein kinase
MRRVVGRCSPSSGLQKATEGCRGAHNFSLADRFEFDDVPLVFLRPGHVWACCSSDADCFPLQRANILKEVQIMRQLDHPNIVKLVDFSESRQYYYIVLELAPGGELFHQIVRLTYFSEDLSRHVITQVAEALEYLHETCGVVHRYVSRALPPSFDVTDVTSEISNPRTYYSHRSPLFQPGTRSQSLRKMKTRLMKESSSKVLDPEVLERLRLPILA